MKSFENLNYYELLEIPVNASFFEIRHAYKEVLSLYDEDSLSTYASFSDERRETLLKKIETAFSTLVDEEKRAEYDKMLLESGKVDPDELTKTEEKKSIPIFQPGRSIAKDHFFNKIREKIKEEGIKKILDEIHAKELISGKDLRRLREAIGIELQEIFEVARISVSMLQAIEGNEFLNLPALVYLKNFLKSYAEILRLDPKKIVDGYIINITLMKK